MALPDIPVLIATPQPKLYESFRGYTLRLSEANGLRTPASMLGLAGMSHLDIRLARHPVEVIAGLTGRDTIEFKGITYSDDNIGGETRLLGHSLPLAYLSLRNSKLCVQCIEELGYAPALWDLVSYTVCHVHKIPLLSVCPYCSQKYKWLRPGLLHCSCGQDIDVISIGEVRHPVTELHKVMDAVLRMVSLSNAESAYGMPLDVLSRMSLNSLLGVIHTLGAHRKQLIERKIQVRALTDPTAEVHTAAEILSEWPNGFLELMKLDMEASSSHSLSIRLRHSQLYTRLFKMGYPEKDMQIFLNGMIQHANNHPRSYTVDKRISKKASVMANSHSNGIYEAAHKAGVMPSTMRRWVKAGKMELVSNSQGKSLIDVDSIHSLLPLAHEYLGLREAAALVRLPVPVLKYLREQGVYQTKHRTVFPGSFAILDLQSMIVSFIALARPVAGNPSSGFVKLSELIQRKFRSKTIKAKLVQAVYNCQLQAYGEPKAIDEILLLNSEVSNLANRLFADETGMYNVRQAKDVIGCDPLAIEGLVSMGMLSQLQINGTVYLDRKRVEAIANEYIPLSQVLKPYGFSSARAIRICAEHGICVLNVPRGSSHLIQPFIRKADSEIIIRLM